MKAPDNHLVSTTIAASTVVDKPVKAQASRARSQQGVSATHNAVLAAVAADEIAKPEAALKIKRVKKHDPASEEEAVVESDAETADGEVHSTAHPDEGVQ
ncbi:MAG: hypothetical protein EON93_17060, partial [Burkholderiales bacterium]